MAGDDIWSRWLLDGRFGGDEARMRTALDFLYPVRDRVLEHAGLSDGEVLLDVGCGDGLIAFGALQRVPSARVIFSDISRPLLDQARSLAGSGGYLDRTEFVLAPADDLSTIPDGSVDVVTTRSVLIYVPDKQRAFKEFHRVLKPGGRLSIFEPVNRFGYPAPRHSFGGFDITGMEQLSDKVKAVFEAIQPAGDPMIDFDERDLLVNAERAGFRPLHLVLDASIEPATGVTWDAFVNVPGNPLIPSVAEAVQQVLDASEAARFMAHLRREFEADRGVTRRAVAYLWGTRPASVHSRLSGTPSAGIAEQGDLDPIERKFGGK